MSAIFGMLYQLQSNAGPIWLAGEFACTLLLTAVTTWFAFRSRRSSFWKRLVYVYFLFTIIGGAVSAADLVISNWTRDSERIFLSYKLEQAYLPILVERYDNMCRERHLNQEEGETSNNYNNPDSIKPLPNSVLMRRLLSDSDCEYIDSVREQLLVGTLDIAGNLNRTNTTGSKMDNSEAQTEMMTPFNGGASEVTEIIEGIQKLRNMGSLLDRRLNALKFISVLKNLGPILLGLGLGVRLARSRYDVQSELAKEARERRRPEPRI